MAIPPRTAPTATSAGTMLRPEASFEAEFPVDEGADPPLAADPDAPDPEAASRVVLTPDGATGEPVADPTAGWNTVDWAEVMWVAVLLEEVST